MFLSSLLSPSPSSRQWSARTLLSASILVLSACADSGDSVAGIPRGAADGLYPQIVVSGSASSTADVNLSLLRKPEGVRLGSYQGELTYDPATLTLERWSLPEGAEGAVNAESAGRLRFVATAVDGVGEVPLLTLRFTRRGAISKGNFGVLFEEVSAAADFSDLTPLVYRGTPAVSVLSR